MSSDFDFLQVQALIGGHVLLADSVESLRIASDWGVGILLPDDVIPDDAEFREVLAEKALRPFLEAGSDDTEVREFHGGCLPPPFFLLTRADITPSTRMSRAFLRIENLDEVTDDIFQAAAVVVSDSHILKQVKDVRGDRLTPVFAEATSAEQARELFQGGVDGSILQFPVNESLIQELGLLMVAGIEQLPVAAPASLRLGIVALQGEYRLQAQRFQQAIQTTTLSQSFAVQYIRGPDDLKNCHAVVLVGGWSNVQTKLLEQTGLEDAIKEFHKRDGFVLGLCAGMILCRSNDGVFCEDRLKFCFVDMTIENNQLNKKHTVNLTSAAPPKYRGEIDKKHDPVFSDGPVISQHGPDVEVLAVTADNRIVAARRGHTIVMAWHNGPSVHSLFLEFCDNPW